MIVTPITIVEVALVIMGDFNDVGGRRGESVGVKMVIVTSITIAEVAMRQDNTVYTFSIKVYFSRQIKAIETNK